jgi:hypothetical protein
VVGAAAGAALGLHLDVLTPVLQLLGLATVSGVATLATRARPRHVDRAADGAGGAALLRRG